MTALLLFKKPLSTAIGRLRSAKGLGVEIDFEQKTAEAEVNARSVIADLERQGAKTDLESDPIRVPSGEDPTYSVIVAFERVSESIRDLVRAARLVDRAHTGDPSPTTMYYAGILEHEGIVNKRFVDSVSELARLRTFVAHGRHKLSYDEAQSYVEAANELVRATQALMDFKFRPKIPPRPDEPTPSTPRPRAFRVKHPVAPPAERRNDTGRPSA
ncbi:MAG: hypothetical protein HGA44_02185 [Cellulomonadaceae bacterium]|nr:hypothetical protein [Cellulomonadaceae bacterium]